jgi:hypothetical protein
MFSHDPSAQKDLGQRGPGLDGSLLEQKKKSSRNHFGSIDCCHHHPRSWRGF